MRQYTRNHHLNGRIHELEFDFIKGNLAKRPDVPKPCTAYRKISKYDVEHMIYSIYKNGDPKSPFLIPSPYAALNILCGSITNFFGTPASNSP